jgi:hypothetical protein
MRNNVVWQCGQAVHSLRTAVCTTRDFIHHVHSQKFSANEITNSYPTLHTYCTQVTHKHFSIFSSVILGLYALSTGPTITTNHI